MITILVGMNHLRTGNAFFGLGSYRAYKFLGNELQETGFYDMNARFYMPDLGMFGQHDPLSGKTLDPYGYAYQNPVFFSDPTGLEGDPVPGSSGTGNPQAIGTATSPIDVGEVILNSPVKAVASNTLSIMPSNCLVCNGGGISAPKLQNTSAPSVPEIKMPFTELYDDDDSYWNLLNNASTAQSYTTNGIGLTLGTTAQVSNNLVNAGKMIKTPNIFKTYNLYRSNGYLNGNKYISGAKFLKNVKTINAVNSSKVVKGIGYLGLGISVGQFWESGHPGYISRGIMSYAAGLIPYVGPAVSLGIDNTDVNYWNIWTWGAMNRGSNHYDYLNPEN